MSPCIIYLIDLVTVTAFPSLPETWEWHFFDVIIFVHVIYMSFVFCFFYDFFVCSVQQECIPTAVTGQDVICQAKSGLGKTAVFVISVLQQIVPVDGVVDTLVICHTRELAFQICNEFLRFTKYQPAVKVSSRISSHILTFSHHVVSCFVDSCLCFFVR